MEVVSATDPSSSSNNNDDMYYTWMSPTLRRGVYRVLNIPCAADSLPTFFAAIVKNGKYAILALLFIYVIFVSICFPFWLLSFIITEWGVYVLFIGIIFLIGRIIIRLLVFPGSSSRVSGEIEREFSKYSIRMLTSSVNALLELTTAISKLESDTSNPAFADVASAWKRVKQFRNRVLSVYYNTLVHIYDEQAIHSVLPPNSSKQANEHNIDHFGNNCLIGDIGNLSGVTMEAQSDGRRLMTSLGQVLSEISSLENKANALLNNVGRFVPQDAVNNTIQKNAQALSRAVSELKTMLPSLAHDSVSSANGGGVGNDTGLSIDPGSQNDNEGGGGRGAMLDAAKSTAGAILPLIDPAPHTSIFGLDVLRGTVLSRYKGASQIWISRPKGGQIDAFHIPAIGWDSTTNGRNRKAVMYCNPNAGLIEVATGMSLATGNLAEAEETDEACWTDFYTRKGYDVYLFNYAGFGRSRGSAEQADKSRASGCIASFARVLNIILFQFKPTPASLRIDAVATGSYLINELGIDSLIIHGESIGGMAAAGAAKGLTLMQTTKDKVALLVCDRTFCNLQAVAQRLIGNWSAYAISTLAPLWNTDVAGDFLAATCPKLVAQDHADMIIADTGSLKSGISLWKEIRKESSTKSLGWAMKVPTEYLAADYEDVGVLQSRISPSTAVHIQAPSWPTNRTISEKEALHFAACARRIGKVATSAQRASRLRSNSNDESGIELDFEGNADVSQQLSITDSSSSPIITAWKFMSCCDGLCGALLGSAVKNGHDYTFTWLCCTLTFGGQTVARSAERRLTSSSSSPLEPFKVTEEDFVCSQNAFEYEENEFVMYPKSIPEVIRQLKSFLEIGDSSLQQVKHELSYCIEMFEYIVDRLASSQVVESSRQGLNFQGMTGLLQNLQCGHNNLFLVDERAQLANHLNMILSHQRQQN